MNERLLKTIIGILSVVVIWSVFFKDDTPAPNNYHVEVQTRATAADGLNLQLIGPLLKKAQDPASLEKLLNDPATGVNNLDLNEDGKVDYLQVSEYGKGKQRGLSITTSPAPGEVQEVATLLISPTADGKDKDKVDVEVRGNPQIYGQSSLFHSVVAAAGTAMLFSYLFRPHQPYTSPWSNGGSSAPNYQQRPVMDPSDYRQRHESILKSSPWLSRKDSVIENPITSPNASKTSSQIKAPLKSPTRSQRAFATQNDEARQRAASGRAFGRHSGPKTPASRGGFMRNTPRPRPSFGGFGGRRGGGGGFGRGFRRR